MTIISYDGGLVDEVATTLDMRRPNREALDAFAKALDSAEPGTELVADLATGVGKTYIAGGLLDYLYGQGVRNVVIVTPGSTIQNKTVANLTPGSPKYLRGLQSNPLVITLDDLERGTVGAALDDPDKFKVFVFTVQSLLKPNTKENRRAHRAHEVLGQSLSDYLSDADDLVVIADEHHVYFNRTAKQFRKAIDGLEPSALIGLTATPHDSTKSETIIYHYPLAAAIADGYVKVPVLVARQDKASDVRTQMADGIALLDAKAAAMRRYTDSTKQPFYQPILFVVAQTIDEANDIAAMLAAPELLDGAEKVLTVTSEEPDEVLRQLDALEETDSPIRAVVSVAMLGLGWDVKNIYVIAAVRKLESELLTEQILGRGLRLPFGHRTGVGMLDTVEVLSHHAFSDLLAEAKVLLSQTLGERAGEATATATSTPGVAGENVNLDDPTSAECDTVVVTLPGGVAPEVHPGQGALFDPEDDDESTHQVGLISTVAARVNEGEQVALALATPLRPREPGGTHLPLFLPIVTYKWVREAFSLSQIDPLAVEALGTKWANDNAPTLTRKKLDATRGDAGDIKVVISDAQDEVEASTLPIAFENVKTDLVKRLMATNAVESSVSEMNAADAIAQSFLDGARVTVETPWRVEHGRLATEALTNWIAGKQTSVPAKLVPEVALTKWPVPEERTEGQPAADRQLITSSRKFIRGYPYSGWNKSFYSVASFDSYSAEFKFAELAEGSKAVKAWLRINNFVPIAIRYQLGANDKSYCPDFIVIDDAGTRWVVETKADSEMSSPTVTAKRDAAFAWVDAVNASETIPDKWGYVLASESVIKNAPNWDALKAAAQTHT